MVAWPLPGRLGLGAFVRDERLTALAVAAGHPLPGLRWEALGARSAPPADPRADEWFTDEPPWPGGPLAHAALRGRVAGGGIEAAAAAGASFAERAPPGGWALLRLHGDRGCGSGELLLGLADGAARDTAGALLRPLRRAAVRAESRAAGLRGWAEASASCGPDAVALRAGAGTPALTLEAGLQQREGGALAWDAVLRLERRRVAAEARRAGSGRLTAEARWKPGPLEIGLQSCWTWRRFEELQVDLEVHRPRIGVELSAGWSAAEGRPWVSVGARAASGLRRGAPR